MINAIERLGESVKVASNAEEIECAERTWYFREVGAFGSMMRILEEKQFVSTAEKLPQLRGALFWASALGNARPFSSMRRESSGYPPA